MSIQTQHISTYAAYQSSLRNMFLSSTAAVALFGFSSIFKDIRIKKLMKYIGITILCVSATIGIKSAYDFHLYLQDMKDLPDKYRRLWNAWIYINIIYVIILVTIIVLLAIVRL